MKESSLCIRHESNAYISIKFYYLWLFKTIIKIKIYFLINV
jgi:hypothetical protein